MDSEDQIGIKLKEVFKRIWKGEGFPDNWRVGFLAPFLRKEKEEE